MSTSLNAQYQIVWSIFFQLPSDEKDFYIGKITKALLDKDILKVSNERSLKDWIDSASTEDGIKSISLLVGGPATREIRAYAQKKKKDILYHKTYFDEIKFKKQDKNILLNYVFEVLFVNPNIVVIEVKTQPFDADLLIDDFRRLSHLPISDSNSNLHNYVRRLCRFILDWKTPDPFNQRQQTEDNISITVIPTIEIGFRHKESLKYFKETQKREVYGILTKVQQWESVELSRVDKLLAKNLSPLEDHLLLIEKSGALLTGLLPIDNLYKIQTRSIIKLTEIAFIHGYLLDIFINNGKEKSFSDDFIDSICDNISHSFRVTKSDFLREVWENSLVVEFSLLDKIRYVKEIKDKNIIMNKQKNNSKGSKELAWKIVTSIILLGFALAGFVWLPSFSAILWLIFLIVAYPVALAFTTSKQSMSNSNLVEIYKAGLSQVPVIGKFFKQKLSP